MKFLVPVFIFLVTLEGLTFLWRKWDSRGNSYTKQTYDTLVKGDKKLNPEIAKFFFSPGSTIRHAISPATGPKTEAIYKISPFGIRENVSVSGQKNENLLMSGCSFVFGLGLNVEESLPGRLSVLLPQHNVVNLGIPSGGVHTALRFFEVTDQRKLTINGPVTYLYSFMPFQLQRWHQRFPYFKYAYPGSPYYKWSGKELVYQGTLDSHPRYRLALFLDKFSIGTLLLRALMDFYPEFSQAEKDSFYDGVVELRSRFLKIWPDGRFVFLVHPQDAWPELIEELKVALTARGIEFHEARTDFVGQRQGPDSDYVIPGDGHPNGKLNEFLSVWISENVIKKASQNQKSHSL